MQLLTLKEAAGYLHINYQRLRTLVSNGHVPGGKIGRSWRFNKQDLDDFLRSQYAKETSNAPF